MAQQAVLLQEAEGVATITLHRPEARNALTPQMGGELAEALRRVQDGPARCLVITGVGEAFCAGADIRDFQKVMEEGGQQAVSDHLLALASRLHEEVIFRIRRLPIPVIASVNGVAAGAGFSLALSADLRIASEDALMVMGYSGIGLTADGGSTYLLPRLIGHGRAMDLYLNNRVVDARQALEIGLVNQVTPADQLADTVGTTARRLAQGATAAFGEVKALMDQAYQQEEPAQLEAEARKLADMGLTEDFREGITAFLAKRPPKFQGR